MPDNIFSVNPSKIVAVGLNYSDHAAELGFPLPEEPVLFLKPPSAIIYDGGTVIYPSDIGRLDYEAELAVVIGKEARRVLARDAHDYIAGYTCLNDVTARDLQKKDGQWTRAKSFDTFCPVGPKLQRGLDPSSLSIELLLNGKVMQSSNTNLMVFKVPRLIEFISDIMTLFPGDIIATGTPAGIGPMNPGDKVTVRIEGIGDLTNEVVCNR